MNDMQEYLDYLVSVVNTKPTEEITTGNVDYATTYKIARTQAKDVNRIANSLEELVKLVKENV